MLKIILIRPGTTEFDTQGRILGTLDVPLSDEGNSVVANTVAQLKEYALDTVYAAPSESAIETAEKIGAGLDIKSKVEERLHNIDYGLWQGQLVNEVKRTQPKVYKQWQDNPESVCPPGGEMLAEFEKRVRVAIPKIMKRHKQGVIGIVAPEPLATMVSMILRQEDTGELFKSSGNCGSWEVIDIEPAELTKA